LIQHHSTDRSDGNSVKEGTPIVAATYRIPFNRPTSCANDLLYMQDAVASGKLSGDGPYTRRAQAMLQEALGVHRVLLTTSCTDALEMSALLLDLQPGDEVIVPSFTFVSSVNAFVLRGARPVFADIRPDTLGLDDRLLAGLVTARTRAIVVVHYAGVACDMEAISTIARDAHAVVIEDNAHGLFGRFRGRLLGTFGSMATLSFHDSKNLTCGEGGALLINDHALVERAEIVREKGTDRSRFLRGQIDKYGWVDLGSSFLPADILAAMLVAQLEDRDAIQRMRAQLWQRYSVELEGWAAAHGVVLPVILPDRESSFHMFNVLAPDVAFRDGLFAHLKARGIQAVSHYIPLHLAPMGRRFGGREGMCPVAEDVNERLIRLPFFTNMTAIDQEEVIAAIQAFPGAGTPSTYNQ
jgi:dTDP-4-amino-4,6-dideoxygalactose transaminase